MSSTGFLKYKSASYTFYGNVWTWGFFFYNFLCLFEIAQSKHHDTALVVRHSLLEDPS